MRARPYPDEVRSEAVRLVVEQRFTAAEAALRLGLRSEAVRVWVRRYRSQRESFPEYSRLKWQLRELSAEQEVLMKLAARLLQRAG